MLFWSRGYTEKLCQQTNMSDAKNKSALTPRGEVNGYIADKSAQKGKR